MADDLNIDTATISIRPHELHISSGELGEVAAAIWMEPPSEWAKWKQRLIAEGDYPPKRDLDIIIEKVRQLPFVQRAWWAAPPGAND